MPASPRSATLYKLFAHAFLAMTALSFFAAIPAHAQYAQPLQNPNDIANQIQDPANQAPTPGALPPPGSGPTPTAEIKGDTGTAPTDPTGTADQTAGTTFPTGTGQNQSMVRIFVNNTNTGRGLRMVQTLRPSTLTADQLSQIQGILGVNLASGEPVIDVTATTDQMAQINAVMAPYPQTQSDGNGRNQINSDSPAAGYPKETAKYNFQGPLPTVRTFCRYLVLLGVVASTIFMAISSFKVVRGVPYAGQHVVQSAAGLMLLLMGYTIWKIVQMETFNFNSNDPPVIAQKSGQGAVSTAYLKKPNTPVVPTAPNNTIQRSGLPVTPLSGN
jgi:hypothetical protein